MGERLNAPYYAIHVKGLEVDAADPRTMVTRALTYAVSTRGACHLRGNPYIDEFITPEEAVQQFGTPAVSDVNALEGKGSMVAWSENWATLGDVMGLCKFAWYRSKSFPTLISRGLELVSDFYEASTGLPMNADKLYSCGERVYNVEKIFNYREGCGRKEDYPPARFFEEAAPDGPGKGKKLSMPEYGSLLDDYYEARGWDKETGRPTSDKLKSLDLANYEEQL